MPRLEKHPNLSAFGLPMAGGDPTKSMNGVLSPGACGGSKASSARDVLSTSVSSACTRHEPQRSDRGAVDQEVQVLSDRGWELTELTPADLPQNGVSGAIASTRIPPEWGLALEQVERYGWPHVYSEAPQPTVMHWAAAEGRADICARLIGSRADPQHLDRQGLSALDHARGGGHTAAWHVLSVAAATGAGRSTVEPRRQPSGGDRKLARTHSDYPISEVPPLDLEGVVAAAERPGPCAASANGQQIPAVYASALAVVERYGWMAVHDGRPEWTALHWAASEGRTDVCMRLLHCGAGPLHKDDQGLSAVDYAREGGHGAALAMLSDVAAVHGSSDMISGRTSAPP